jgi:CTP:molybdopterin cytidylyltransferase MocA
MENASGTDGRTEPVVAGLLLAAGGGRRLGGHPKALLPYRGRPLVESAARALRAGGCGPVHVVLGAEAARVAREALLPGCATVENPGWAAGMGSSLRAGLAALAGSGADAVVVTLVDQPGVGAAAVARVRAACRSRNTLAAAAYQGRRGHPVLLGAGHWEGVARDAVGDRGARGYLRAHQEALLLVECGGVADPYDIDTPDDLRLLERGGPGG